MKTIKNSLYKEKLTQCLDVTWSTILCLLNLLKKKKRSLL